MARVCQVTGKRPMVGNNVSHANNKTKRRFLPNLQYRRFWVEAENRWVRLRISNAALRSGIGWFSGAAREVRWCSIPSGRFAAIRVPTSGA